MYVLHFYSNESLSGLRHVRYAKAAIEAADEWTRGHHTGAVHIFKRYTMHGVYIARPTDHDREPVEQRIARLRTMHFF